MQEYAIKLISPGPGSSGYYPPQTLEQAAEEKVWAEGTPMFWVKSFSEHGNPDENPEKFAGVLTSDARYEPNGRDGAGLYASAMVFSDYQERVDEKAPYMGLSIVGEGEFDDDAELPDGQRGRVITRITNGRSVDFVMRPGRDGKVIFESAGSGESLDRHVCLPVSLLKETKPMSNTDLVEAQRQLTNVQSQLAESQKQAAVLADANSALVRRLVESEAVAVRAKLWGQEKYNSIPEAMRTMIESAVGVTAKESGDLDAVVLAVKLQESADAYLASVPAPAPSGGVYGQGESGGGSDFMAEAVKKYQDKYKLSEAEARRVLGVA